MLNPSAKAVLVTQSDRNIAAQNVLNKDRREVLAFMGFLFLGSRVCSWNANQPHELAVEYAFLSPEKSGFLCSVFNGLRICTDRTMQASALFVNLISLRGKGFE